ncbi:hypothetical protein LY78DRAFT_131759 [Colletotrichum sublineola]|nr:hypothetical protein LY78DRAFT_131759 [Colletotrichum sublineola]
MRSNHILRRVEPVTLRRICLSWEDGIPSGIPDCGREKDDQFGRKKQSIEAGLDCCCGSRHMGGILSPWKVVCVGTCTGIPNERVNEFRRRCANMGNAEFGKAVQHASITTLSCTCAGQEMSASRARAGCRVIGPGIQTEETLTRASVPVNDCVTMETERRYAHMRQPSRNGRQSVSLRAMVSRK